MKSSKNKRYSRQDAEGDLTNMRDGATKEWLDSRPPQIQRLYHQYPPTTFYRVKSGAPYKHTGAGCVGAIQGYQNSLDVVFTVLKDLNGHIGYTAEIDPRWLEPVDTDVFPDRDGYSLIIRFKATVHAVIGGFETRVEADRARATIEKKTAHRMWVAQEGREQRETIDADRGDADGGELTMAEVDEFKRLLDLLSN